jgi:hypothetical protein
MEKTNWINTIVEIIRVAMNKGLHIKGYKSEICGRLYDFIIYINGNEETIQIAILNNRIIINTLKGQKFIDYKMTDRENLEIQAMFLSVKEYSEDMAISEIEEFISDKKEEITDINNLDDDD